MAQKKKAEIRIAGMTCTSCEDRIEKVLQKIDGVYEVHVSFDRERASIAFDPDMVSLEALVSQINIAGYEATAMGSRPKQTAGSHEVSSKRFGPIQMAGVAVIGVALFLLVKNTIGFNTLPQVTEGMGLGALFVVGLITSLHCIAMCGGINLSQCVGGSCENERAYKPSLLYNAGRVVSYTVIGGLVGALGSVVTLSGPFKGTVSVLAGAFMMIMGINMLGLMPSLRKYNVRLPKSLARIIAQEKKKARSPFYVGLLNGLMPCGPLQAMQLYALGTGSFVSGAMAMFFFSLGTVPLMFGFGAVSTLLSGRFTKNMMKFSGALVIILGLVMAGRGLALSGVNTAYALTSDPLKDDKYAIAQIRSNVQEVTIELDDSGYQPIVVQKGIPVRFNIHAAPGTIDGCNGAIVINAFGIEKTLEVGDNWIDFTPTETGSIGFSCWMGMITSSIQVVDDIGAVDTSQLKDPIVTNDSMPCCQFK